MAVFARKSTSGLIVDHGGTAALMGRSWRVIGTGDFDDDGYTDILWRNSKSGNEQGWLMHGRTKSPTSGPIQ